jgi:hypothetical protein
MMSDELADMPENDDFAENNLVAEVDEVELLFRLADELYTQASETGSASLERRALIVEMRWLKARAKQADRTWIGVNHTMADCACTCSLHNGL